jgi:hypothetical protein
MDAWQIRNKEEEYTVAFSQDMVEKCLGQYTRLKKKMLEVEPDARTWMIQTNIEVKHPVGEYAFTINLYDKGLVVIYNTLGPRMHGHNINDVRFLKKAITWMGWSSLTITPSEIDSSIDFWKRCWETGLIDSDYLSAKYKKKD